MVTPDHLPAEAVLVVLLYISCLHVLQRFINSCAVGRSAEARGRSQLTLRDCHGTAAACSFSSRPLRGLIMSSSSRQQDRSLLRGSEMDIFRPVSATVTTAQWVEWLRAQLESAAAEGNYDLATTLLAAGANGNLHGRERSKYETRS